jgi:hypothetical protein
LIALSKQLRPVKCAKKHESCEKAPLEGVQEE